MTQTHFGYQQVDEQEKAAKVAEVFHEVAAQYDLMNDLMSLGMHRLWKRHFVSLSGLRKGQRALDLACGTGDISQLLAKQVGADGLVIGSDINGSMLNEGRDRHI